MIFLLYIYLYSPDGVEVAAVEEALIGFTGVPVLPLSVDVAEEPPVDEPESTGSVDVAVLSVEVALEPAVEAVEVATPPPETEPTTFTIRSAVVVAPL